MKHDVVKSLYLCGIGSHNDVKDFRVGRYDEKRDSFMFGNGSYSSMELYREPKGNDSTYVISAVSLDMLDDAGLLYEQITNSSDKEEK